MSRRNNGRGDSRPRKAKTPPLLSNIKGLRVNKDGQYQIDMKPSRGEAQKQNHKGLRPKVDNIISIWIEESMLIAPIVGILNILSS